MYIGIDIGGTHTRVAIGEGSSFSDKKDFPTGEFAETLEKIKLAVKSFDLKSVRSAGVSVAGPYNFKRRLLLNPPNLPKSWREKDIGDLFTKELSIPTYAAHDASVAALGEAVHGAGKGKNPVLYYTVSTGIGSGVIVDGKIYRGIFNPEAGHQLLNKNGETLEDLASGKSIEEKTGKKSVEAEGSQLWEAVMDWVGIGIANSILHFSPEIVVVGGGMTKHEDVFFTPLKKSLEKHLTFFPQIPVVPSSLGQDNGLIGALELAKHSGD